MEENAKIARGYKRNCRCGVSFEECCKTWCSVEAEAESGEIGSGQPPPNPRLEKAGEFL